MSHAVARAEDQSDRRAVFSAIVLALLWICCTTGAFGRGVEETAHDLTVYPWLPSGYSCLPCHSAQATFNHELSTQTYTISRSPTLDAADLGQPDGVSAKCLSCHDGTVPLDSFGGNKGSTYMTGSAVMGTDLTGHHPVSFTYNSALAARDGRLNDPAATPSGLGGTIARDMLADGRKLQCDTCHDQHAQSGLSDFLVKPIEGAALCHTCHKQPATADGHHIPGRHDPWKNCTMCHGDDLRGDMGPSCMACHNDFSAPDPPQPGHHMPNRDAPFGAGNCTMCHGGDLTGDMGPSCFSCHGQTWPDNLPPLADPNGPYTGETGSPVQFDGSGSADADGTIVAYDWDFGDGSTGTGVSPSHTYGGAGVYTVALTVTDNGGATDGKSTTADVSAAANLPPMVNAGGPYTGVVGQEVRFDASGTSDPDGDPLSYEWNFGDGTAPPPAGQSPTISHTYAEAGTYTAQLAVTDGHNHRVLAEVAVEITEGTEPPEGGDWVVKIPYLFAEFTITIDEFAGILSVRTTHAGGDVTFGIGAEFDGVVFWMDATGAIFFGNVDRAAGTMRGIVFDYFGGSSIWFAERL